MNTAADGVTGGAAGDGPESGSAGAPGEGSVGGALAGGPIGGETAGGDTAGGKTAGGDTAGGKTAGGETAGGKTAGGDTGGGKTAGEETAGALPVLAVDLTADEAFEALTAVLLGGLDPEGAPARLNVPVPAGELLLMPAATSEYAGVKIAGVAPTNPAAGLPRITGSYLLLDGPSLMPVALMDGIALTSLRTPAVTAVALDRLAAADAAHLVLFGTGPQAYGHLDALRAVRPLERVTVVGRRPGPVRELVAYAQERGLAAAPGAPDAVAQADLVVCCTTATEPLFDGALVPDHAAVAAVGSHSPVGREVDAGLVRRAACYVEARAVALREAGDLLLALPEEVAADPRAREAAAKGWTNLGELVGGRAPVPTDRPRFFKSVGMAWQDLAVAAAVHRRSAG